VTSPGPRITSYDYDDLNRVVTTTNALSGQIITTYDALGRQVAVQDANHHVSHYGYDSLGCTIAVTDALEHVSRFTSECAASLKRSGRGAVGQPAAADRRRGTGDPLPVR
jgi:YD repeat-containing protein